tara:strand:- start:27 stop:434 length:408 start_codon:yes stop_codon:yes gene_type:complete
MSIKSHLESAEESIRQAIINSLADKKDENLSDLFQALALVKDINSKTFEFNPGNINLSDVDYSVLNNDPITFSSEAAPFSFNLSSDYLSIPGKRPGGDMDAMDDITFAAGPVDLPGAAGEDVISFTDYKESREDS